MKQMKWFMKYETVEIIYEKYLMNNNAAENAHVY